MGAFVGDADISPSPPCVEVLVSYLDPSLGEFVDNTLCRLSAFWPVGEVGNAWASSC